MKKVKHHCKLRKTTGLPSNFLEYIVAIGNTTRQARLAGEKGFIGGITSRLLGGGGNILLNGYFLLDFILYLFIIMLSVCKLSSITIACL